MKVQHIPDKYEVLVSTEELSRFLGLSPRRVQQLIKANVLRTDTRGNHPLFENLRGYIIHLRFLLRRYMSLYRIEVERTNRRTHFQNLAFYEDIVTPALELTQEQLAALFGKKRAT
jgi:hypothetical protein